MWISRGIWRRASPWSRPGPNFQTLPAILKAGQSRPQKPLCPFMTRQPSCRLFNVVKIIMNHEYILHPFPPTWDNHSRILILGSFPSVKSREVGYFYGHPQNRFWKVLAAIFEEPVPEEIEVRRDFLLRNRVAVWDVLASCEITGSSDSSIRNAFPNDIQPILLGADIRQIYCNGKLAFRSYQRFLLPETHREAVCLPSTSPANAAWSLSRLTEAWTVIKSPV